MQSTPQILQYFGDYCERVEKLSAATRRNYLRGLKKVSSFLMSKGLIKTDIYNIESIDQLKRLKEILSADPDFVAFNSKGHRMYSGALSSYINFVSGRGWSTEGRGISVLDQPMPVKAAQRVERLIQPRSHIIKQQALAGEGYRCELDYSHETFFVEETGKQYMEGHHAIPMSLQHFFEYSLDVYANIVCLCPTCHRKIHYAGLDERRRIAMQLYEKKSERLEKSGIALTKDRFIALTAPERSLQEEFTPYR